jgi:FkbM family methyltransferase
MIENVLAFARRVRTTIGGERVWETIRPAYWKTMAVLTGVKGARLSFPDGYSYRIAPQFYAWQMDNYEPAVVHELTRTLTETSVVYDVGAHVGIMTLMAARRVTRGCVYAFEPAPPNYRLLQRHVRVNGYGDRVVTARVLVGDRLSPAIPFVHRLDQFTANSLAYAIDEGQATNTPMTTIDEIVLKGKALPPTHMKIDVEGYEAAVLRGARATLRAFRPIVICAIHPEPLRLLGETGTGVVRFLTDLGYVALNLQGKPVTVPAFEEVVFRPANQP